MQVIYYSETKRKIRERFTAHNNRIERVQDSRGRWTRDRKKTLGAAHLKCALAIVDIFSAQLNKMHLAALKGEIPNVYTSNGQLAEMIKASPRTVQRYIKRLQAGGIIIGKTFHGSSHAYELRIDPEVLHLAPVLTVAYIHNLENEAAASMLQQAATSCPDTDTQKITKKLIRADELLTSSPALLTVNNSESFFIDREKQGGKSPANDAGTQVLQGEKIAGVLGEKTHGVSPAKLSEPLLSMAVMLWNYTARLLYTRIDYLSDSEKKFALQFFISQLTTSPHGPQQKTIFHELKSRLEIAASYLQKDSARYIPIPSRYFDITNLNGFSRTLQWLHTQRKGADREDYRAFKLAQQEAAIFNRYMNFYLRNRGDVTAYRKVENYFAKNRPEMLESFYEIVIEDQHGLHRLNDVLKIKKRSA